jgi:hypothetical protein
VSLARSGGRRPGQPVGLDHPRGRSVADRVAELSRGLGTEPAARGDELVVLGD